MEAEQHLRQEKRRRFPWIRMLVMLGVSLLIATATILALLSTGQRVAGYWLAIIPILFSAVGVLIPLGQWLFPISTESRNGLPTALEVKVSLSPPVSEITPADQAKQPLTLWNVPYRRNPYFTGREEVLEHLHTRLSASNAAALTQSQAISGLGGIGKTQIAVEYAYRHQKEYQGVLWVNAASRETIIASFLELASLLELPERQEAYQSKIVIVVRRWLTRHEHWLLIFDNADDLTLAEEFLPANTSGSLLFTTRNQSAGTLAESLDIQTMEQEEGTLLVLRRAKLLAREQGLDQAKPEERVLAEQIVQEMDGLPLALDQAAAYIEETSCTIAAFLDTYQRQREEILRRRGGTSKEHPLPVATTWSLSFAQVKQINPAAADLLRVCAFLAPDAIPEEMFIAWASHLSPYLSSLGGDRIRLDEAVATLYRFSLVHRNREERTLSLHRLVQDAQLMDMNKRARKQWAKRTVRAVYLAFLFIEFPYWPICERCLPHALYCARLIETNSFTFREAAGLLNNTALYLHERGQYSAAEPLYQRALAINEQALGQKHSRTATNLNNLAELYRDQGKYEQAEPLYQRALAIRERVFGQKHPETATSLNNLALLYYAQGKYEQAEPLFQRALAIDEQAKPFFQRVLPIVEQAFGQSHPNTARSLNNLALLYDAQGKYEQAEPLFQRALSIVEQALGQSHPDTATSLNNLAELYHVQGKYEQAEPLYQRALAIQEQVFGQSHPDTALSLNNLALLYSNQGKYERAEPLFQRALSILDKTLGPNHPTAKTVRANYTTLLESIKPHKK